MPTEITKEIEERAAGLGAAPWAIAKWRVRGIPPKWQIKLFGLNGGAVTPNDFRPPEEEAASSDAPPSDCEAAE